MGVTIQVVAGFTVAMALFHSYKDWSRIRRRAARLSRGVSPGGSSAPMFALPGTFRPSPFPDVTYRVRPEEELPAESSTELD
jgi:hypothetical protein